MYAYLGGHTAIDPGNDNARVKGKQRLEVSNDDGASAFDVFEDITRPGGIVRTWVADNSNPTWVASDSDELATMLAAAYGAEIRKPLPAGEQKEHAGRPSVQRLLGGPLAALLLTIPLLMMLGRFYLRTSAGIDWQSDIMGNAAGVPAKYMALSATSGESAAHTALAGEITTAGGGLIRVAATYAHTTSTTTYTLTKTFTANGSDALPVTVKQVGLLTASSAGVLAFEKIITDTLFAASGDAATITYTVTP